MSDATSINEQSEKIIHDATEFGKHPDEPSLKAQLKDDIAKSDPKAVEDAIKDLRGQQGSALNSGRTQAAEIYKTASEQMEQFQREAQGQAAMAEVQATSRDNIKFDPLTQATSRDTIRLDAETQRDFDAANRMVKDAMAATDPSVSHVDREKARTDIAEMAKENPAAAKMAIGELAREAQEARTPADGKRSEAELAAVVQAAPQEAKEVSEQLKRAAAKEPADSPLRNDYEQEARRVDNALKSDTAARAHEAVGQGQGKLEPAVYHPPAPGQAHENHPQSPAHKAPETLLKHEIIIAQAAEKAADAKGADKVTANKELENQVKAAPEAARAFIKDADTTHMDMASIDAMVAVRDALQKSDAANIIKDAMKGNTQELSRLARTDRGAAEIAVATLKSEGGHEDHLAAIKAAMSGAGVKGGTEVTQHAAPVSGAKTQQLGSGSIQI